MRVQRKFKNQTDKIIPDTEIKKIHQSLLQKNVGLWMRQTEQVEQEFTPKNQIRMQKQVHVVKQAVVKRKMLECVKVGEKVILIIQTKNQMEKVLKRKRLNYLSVVEKVTW